MFADQFLVLVVCDCLDVDEGFFSYLASHVIFGLYLDLVSWGLLSSFVWVLLGFEELRSL